MEESASNLALETKRQGMNKWEAYTALWGISIAMARGYAAPGSIESLNEAREVLNAGKEGDNNQNPPKPPRKPNAKIGGLVLSNS